MRIARGFRRRMGYVAIDPLQAAIIDEFAGKLAAIDCCVPKADRAAARQALLSERAAKLRRVGETLAPPRISEAPICEPLRQRMKRRFRKIPCSPSRPLRKLSARRLSPPLKTHHVA
jgi:hypothetical protein